MAYPFFSLAKTPRIAPIDFIAGSVAIRVEAVPDHGMATIWDADILIWAGSQIVDARDAGLRTSRLMAITPYEILKFIGRGTSLRDYQRLKAALNRLQSTTVSTTIRQPAEGRRHRFSWINEWKERTDRHGKAAGIELIVSDWFYQAVLDDALVLTIDRAYFDLTGGLERWLYRIARKHGGHQRQGWRFDFHHLHRSRAACRRSSASPSSCATSSGDSLCRATLNAIHAVMMIEVVGKSTTQVIRKLRGMPEIYALHTTNGNWDLVADIRSDSLSEFDRVLREIRMIDGVSNSETSLLLSSV